jgi:phosphoglycerate kinase
LQVNKLIICGGMSFTFKKTLENVQVSGMTFFSTISRRWLGQIGESLFDEAGAQKVAELVEKAKAKGVELYFPVDYVTADKFSNDAEVSEWAAVVPLGSYGLFSWWCPIIVALTCLHV